jgi:hypothetical protein
MWDATACGIQSSIDYNNALFTVHLVFLLCRLETQIRQPVRARDSLSAKKRSTGTLYRAPG